MMKLILSELKKISRDVRPMIMMLVIPILLTITLGTSLKNLFETSIETKENLVLYHIQDQGAYHIQFQNLVSSLKDEGFIFISTNTFEEGLNAVKNGKYNCFVYISSNYSAVEIYENNKEPLKVSFVEEMLRKFLYPLYIGSSWISKGEKSNAPSDLVELVKMPLPKKPSSIDYYSVTMLTMIILYS
ncbi:MAG TPA: ABC transporter permease, partial [Petrotogaceae bacterium]|nr:ABC transporter permease [Petrotogaceae bacterium]